MQLEVFITHKKPCAWSILQRRELKKGELY